MRRFISCDSNGIHSSSTPPVSVATGVESAWTGSALPATAEAPSLDTWKEVHEGSP